MTSMGSVLPSEVSLAWRPETAWLASQRSTLTWTEVIAENIAVDRDLPPALVQLRERGVRLVPHGVSLSLGSADPPHPRRLKHLRRLADRLDAPLVSEHLAFVRGGGYETEHLLPVERTPASLAILVDNVRRAEDAIGRPLAIENVARLLEWPGAQIPEATFLAELTRRTGCLLLLDAANLAANVHNFGERADAYLDALPMDRVAYVHVAGGRECAGFLHDTHADPVGAPALEVLRNVLRRRPHVPVLLERDDGFGTRGQLEMELDALGALVCAAREERDAA
jgi:uncharacterized protein (UPF0276 family)